MTAIPTFATIALAWSSCLVAAPSSALVASSAACADEKAVSLPHDWTVGTRYHVEHTHVQEEFAVGADGASRVGEPPVTTTTVTTIDVEVIGRAPDGYTYRWTYGRPATPPPPDMPAEVAEGVMDLVTGLNVDLAADASGSITRVVNLKDMEAHFAKKTDALVAKLSEAKGPAREMISFVASNQANLKGAALENAYSAGARKFYLASGSVLVPHERKTWEDRLPNPFGGDDLPSVSSIEMSDVDRATNRAVVEWRQTIDPTKAGPILEASIRAYAKRRGQELPAEATLSFDAIEDAATWTYDLSTGVPTSLVTTRATTMAGTRRIDTNRFVTSAYRAGPDAKATPPVK